MDSESELNKKTAKKPSFLGRALSFFHSSLPLRSNRHSFVAHQLMLSTHPLELLELLELVVAYLPRRSLPACARVSKTWYQACVPLIWSDIDWDKLRDSTVLIQSHSHLVKKIKTGSMSKEHAAVRFQNLVSFELTSRLLVQHYCIEFIMQHPTITRLVLRKLYDCPPAFWDALLGFQHLTSLYMSSFALFGANIDKFWQLATRLEQLDIDAMHYTTVNISIPPGAFSRIKHLGVDVCYPDNVPFFMDLLQQCPGITSIRWDTIHHDESAFVSGLTTLLEAAALPNLEHLDANVTEVSNDDVAKMILIMPRITTLSLRLSYNLYKMDFATILQPHFMNLRVLDVLPDKTIKSRIAQDVMSSCPFLEKLVVPCVDAYVVVEGKPWVCLRLKILHLTFCFDPPSTVSSLQPLVFDQLSKLSRLEEWSINWQPVYAGSVDLRMECGLGKLSTLQQLHTVTLCNVVEKMRHQDVDWILKHWKSLMIFKGNLNTHDEKVRKALRSKMSKHGIHDG